MNERDGQGHCVEGEVDEQADEGGRDQNTHGGEGKDDGAVAAEVVEVEVERAGEKQEAKHAVEESLVKVDRIEDHLGVAVDRGNELTGKEEQQRSGEADDHEADRLREAQEAVIDVAEQRRQGDEGGEDLEQRHGGKGEG